MSTSKNSVSDVGSSHSVFGRGVARVYQHCGEGHLFRYLRELDYRFNRRTALGWNDRGRRQGQTMTDRPEPPAMKRKRRPRLPDPHDRTPIDRMEQAMTELEQEAEAAKVKLDLRTIDSKPDS